MTSKIIPAIAKPICSGNEIFISFLTPDNEVYVEDPVKFIARKEEIAVIIRNHDTISKILSPLRLKYKRIRKMSEPE
jgi:hypothetical protein